MQRADKNEAASEPWELLKKATVSIAASRKGVSAKSILFAPAPGASETEIEALWAARMIRAAASLAVLSGLLNTVGTWSSPSTPAGVAAIHVVHGAVGLAAVIATFLPGFPRFWRPVIFALATMLVATDAAAGVMSGTTIPTVVTILLVSMGTGALVPWGPAWQFAFDFVCLAGWTFAWAAVPPHDDYAVYGWSGVIIACGVAHFASILRKQHAAARSEAERMLRESETKLRQVFEASLDIIVISRLSDGRFVSASPAFRTWGYEPAELIGATGLEIGIWANPAEREEFIRQVSEKGRLENLEVTFRRKDGSLVPCLLSAKVAEMGGESCVVTVVRDITLLKETERELIAEREKALRASQAKSEFVASLSHEIRTPMNALLGMAELLMETRLSEEQRRYVKAMLGNGAALLDLLNDVLDLSRIESGRFALEETGFELVELIDRIAETLGVRAHEKQIELATRIMPEVPVHLIGDPLRLRQVLLNLLGNAVKFTDHGYVLLTVEREAGDNESIALRFSVQDTGIGIPADRLDYIFGRFSQAESSTARKYGGSGLGLSIVKRLVELMGGRVWVESEMGHGSTFRFTAHLRVDRGVEAGPPGGEPDLAGVRVLVVDDTEANRLVLREMLSGRGASVGEVPDGPGALAEAGCAQRQGNPYQVILLDYRMPQMDGIEVAKRLRDAGCLNETAILMLTSDGMGAQLERMRAAGLSCHIVKPIRRAELFQAITRLLGTASAQAAEPAPVAPAPMPARKTVVPAAPSLRVLLAEDSPDNRLLVAAFLKRTSYALEVAENGEQALEKFKSAHYEAVLMDMQMPVMDGYTATHEIRAFEREHNLARTPIVALTGETMDEALAKIAKAGCDAHLGKPYNRAALLAVLENVTATPCDSSLRAAAAGG
jgi:PAS domain S-box-containing protein